MTAQAIRCSDQLADSDTPVLRTKNLTCGYGNVTVLRDVDLLIPKGRVVALLGPNGAGKTTLIRAVAGSVRPAKGGIWLGNRDVSAVAVADRAAAGICVVPEGRGVFPNLSVRENLVAFSPRAASGNGVERALEAFPALKTRLQQRAGTLSGGEQQMVALSRCYLGGAKVVLVDEVSMGLAPRLVDAVYASLEVLARSGMAMLIVEQYVRRALDLAEYAYVMRLGRVVHHGPANALAGEQLITSYFGGPSD